MITPTAFLSHHNETTHTHNPSDHLDDDLTESGPPSSSSSTKLLPPLRSGRPTASQALRRKVTWTDQQGRTTRPQPGAAMVPSPLSGSGPVFVAGGEGEGEEEEGKEAEASYARAEAAAAGGGGYVVGGEEREEGEEEVYASPAANAVAMGGACLACRAFRRVCLSVSFGLSIYPSWMPTANHNKRHNHQEPPFPSVTQSEDPPHPPTPDPQKST